MPFQSKAQMKYLYANEPKVANEFSKKTDNFADLPEKKKAIQKKLNQSSNYMKGANNG